MIYAALKMHKRPKKKIPQNIGERCQLENLFRKYFLVS